MNEHIERLRKALKAHGQSLTASRKIVFEALWKNEALTMHGLVEACEHKADRASIYRTVKMFESIGIIQRIHVGWKYRLELADQFNRHHHHISCNQCGVVVSLPENLAIESLLTQTAKQHGFAPESHMLEIRGLCSSCQAKAKAAEANTPNYLQE